MKQLVWSMFAVGLVTGALIGRVAAQDNIVTEAPAASIAQVPAAAQTYDASMTAWLTRNRARCGGIRQARALFSRAWPARFFTPYWWA
jgi:hypothetical protein